MAETKATIGKRLVATRLALGYESQAEFCRALKVSPADWNKFETGKRMITDQYITKMKRRFGITFDWVRDNDPSALPRALADKLAPAAA